MTSSPKCLRGKISPGELTPQRDRINSNSNSFSGLFWFPKVPRAAGTSVIPQRACQEKCMKKLWEQNKTMGKHRASCKTQPAGLSERATGMAVSHREETASRSRKAPLNLWASRNGVPHGSAGPSSGGKKISQSCRTRSGSKSVFGACVLGCQPM